MIIQHFGFASVVERQTALGRAFIFTAAMVALMYLEAGPRSSFIYFQF